MTHSHASEALLTLHRCDATTVIAIRRWLRQRMPDPERCTDAELVVTELVANAIDHAHGAAAVRIAISATGGMHVEVDDDSTSTLLTPGRSRLGEPRGNGLIIIGALASWGVDRIPTGKTVWAAL